MKRIIVTGAGGFLGARILQQWQGDALESFPKGFLASAGEADVRRFLEEARPDVILHTAALSDTGYCAQHPEEAYRANVELPVWVAKAARETGAKLVAFSSDQVYAGVTQAGPLPERALAASMSRSSRGSSRPQKPMSARQSRRVSPSTRSL